MQGEIPFVSTPFAVVGQQIDMSEKEVIKRAERMRRDGLLRQIAFQFDSRALGYRSCLVAARVTPERIDEAANVVNAHPGVTQNYRRNNDFNLWFTIAVSPLSKLGLEKTVEILGGAAECDIVRPLPTLRLYKSSSSDGGELYSEEAHAEYTPLTPLEIEGVRLLQRDLPLQPRPFEALARTGNITPEDLLGVAKALHKRGQIRKLTAIAIPRKAGFVASTLGVWVVPADQADAIGAKLAQHRAVSHCFLRPTYDDWPYNLYTTVHARSVDECESVIHDLAIDNGLTQRQTLFPTREYKKARLQYFSQDGEQWEEAHGAREAVAAS
ncbi:MAG TPA: Lrp/AsnC family transcriptional regulator [Thermoanaerobaculia bacterium]